MGFSVVLIYSDISSWWGGRQGMPALPKRQWRLDVTHTHDLYIYPLWVKIQLHSIKSEAQRCLLNCHLEGFLLAATVLKLWGNLFASANPLFLLFFFSPFLCVCLCFPYFPPPISSLFISSSPVEHKLLCEWHLCQNQLDCQRGAAGLAALCGLYE